jgi:uncharacterized protein YbjT (DUF2867 family)
MKSMVIGGTGTVGSEVVRQLAGRGQESRVLVRSQEKAEALPAGMEAAIGDLDNEGPLEAAMAGVDRLFLLTPLSETEKEQGLRAVKAAKKQGVGRIVYMSVHDVEKCPQAPHFASKIEIQKAIEDSGIEHVFVMPNNFYQNDAWFIEPLKQWGVYPQPIGDVGISRVDTRDIAEASVKLLLADSVTDRRVPLVGPEAHTGATTAAAWGRHLGKDVKYAGNDLDQWAEQARKMLPGWLVDDFRIMYEFFQKEGLKATPEDLAICTRVLGRPPRRFDDYAAEMARA